MYWNRLSREQVELARNGREYEELCAYLNVQFGYTHESENVEDQPIGSHSDNTASKSYQVEGAITRILRKELKFYQAHQEKSTGYPTLYQVDIDLQKIDQLPARFEEAEHAETISDEGSARDKPLTDGSKSDVSNGSATSAELSDSQSQPVQDANNKRFTNFEWSRVYIVKDHQAQPSGDSNIREWYFLDGERTVLRELNAKFEGIKIDDEGLVEEYLDFFCSFLCGEKGSFALIKDDRDLEKLEDSDRFERALFEKRHRAVRDEVKPFPNELKFNKAKEEIKKCIQNKNPYYPIGAKRITESPSNTSTETIKFQITRLVLYDRRFFYSTFEVLRSGYVEMSEDRQIFPSFAKTTASGAERTPINFDLAVRRYATFRHRKSGLVLYTKSAKRRPISSTQFREYARSSGSVSYLSNLLVEGDVTFGAGENLTGLECSNLQFLDSILFDHCVVSSVLRFEHCQFLGSFGAPGTRFHSQVVVKHSEIFAVANITPTGKKNKIAAYFALELDSARIDGSLTLECLTAHASVSCKHLSVQSDANLSGIRVLPLVEENWERDKEQAFWAAPLSEAVLFDLQRSSFAGSLNLGVWVDPVQAREKSRRRVTVCGRCRFDTMSIGKSLILEGLAVVTPASKKVSGYVCFPSLDMPGVTVKGNIQSWDYDSWDPTGTIINPPLIVDGTIDLKWSTIEGYVDFRTSHIGKELDCRVLRSAWLTLEPSRVDAISVDNNNVEEAGEIDWASYSLTAAHQPKVLGNTSSDWTQQFQRRMSIVQGNLELGNAIIPGGVTLTGTTVEGTVDIGLGAQLGQVKAMPVLGVRRESKKRTVFKQTAFLGRLSIRDSTIEGPIYLWGTRIGKEDAGGQDKAPRPVIDITTSKLKGGLYLHARSNWEGVQVASELLVNGKHWSDKKETVTDWEDHQGGLAHKNNVEDEAHAYFWQTLGDVFHTTVYGDVEVLASDLGADLDLTNTEVKGRIRLNDSYVKCDVRAVTCLQELEPKSTAARGPQQDKALRTELKTECSHFEFQALRCDGDLMLAGLAVAENVDGRNAAVRGHAEFVHEDREAAIEENLNLCGFEVGLLKIGGKSFEKSGTIDLARAKLATLEVSTLPKKINLQSITVGNWNVKDYRRLLKHTEPYDSWPYKSLENSLAAKGNEDDAEKVHVKKNWREWRENFRHERKALSFLAHPVLRSVSLFFALAAIVTVFTPWSSCPQALGLFGVALAFYGGPFVKLLFWDGLILGAIMGFGTRLFLALLIWLGFALFLAFVLSEPQNIQPTFGAVKVGLGRTDLKINADNPADREKLAKARNDLQKRTPVEWGFGSHAIWLALDITVPLVPFNLHDEWEPRETAEGTTDPWDPSKPLWYAPKTLATIFVPISWVIWTLIATGMAGLIRTKK